MSNIYVVHDADTAVGVLSQSDGQSFAFIQLSANSSSTTLYTRAIRGIVKPARRRVATAT